MSASSLRILTLGYSFFSSLSSPEAMICKVLQDCSAVSARAPAYSLHAYLDNGLEFFSSLDEPGKSREARELTWEVHALSMRCSALNSVQSDVPNHDGSVAPVLLCRQKRGIHFTLRRTLSDDSLFDRLMANPETSQNQPVGLVLSDLLTLSTTTSI